MAMIHYPLTTVEGEFDIVWQITVMHFNIYVLKLSEETRVPILMQIELIERITAARQGKNIAAMSVEGFASHRKTMQRRFWNMQVVVLDDAIGAVVVAPEVCDDAEIFIHLISFLSSI